jgi:GNAT superfamily N-acetyltransferase
MGKVVIKPVGSWWDRRTFMYLPWELYRNDPNWIPPLRLNQAELLNYRKHPFYDRAEIQTFLAYRDGNAVGRIAAIINKPHNERYNEQRGFFGFFESINDRAVSDALFDVAGGWLRDRGMTHVRGPANPSMNYECALLTAGFDSPPTFMMTYNPPFYVDLVEGYGFKAGRELFAYDATPKEINLADEKLSNMAAQAVSFSGATIRPLNKKQFSKDVGSFIELYNASLVVNWGFVPLEPSEMSHLAASLKQLLIPELTLFAEVDGRPVGTVCGLPDYNPRIKRINGSLLPWHGGGAFTLLSSRGGFDRMRVLSINVVPEFQKWGLGLALMLGLVPKALSLNISNAEFSWIDEENSLARKGLEKAGAVIAKRFRMYDRAL